jgi:hypothetical protein
LLVSFWFDGGLFKLATASVFWILLELGAETKRIKSSSIERDFFVLADEDQQKQNDQQQRCEPPDPMNPVRFR